MDQSVKRNREWFRLCDHFIESEDPWGGCYCKLRAGHEGEHSQHYPPSTSVSGGLR